VELTEDFATFHPLLQAPGLVQFLILDDANTSDHHCFVFDLPIAGSILFLPHDNEMRIAFRNLDDFSEAIQSALRTGRRLSDFHTQDTLLGLDQSVLNAAIRRGLETSDFVPVSLLIQASDLIDLELFLSIVGHPDWAYAGNGSRKKGQSGSQKVSFGSRKKGHLSPDVLMANPLCFSSFLRRFCGFA
jgi:hypothetical protein